MLDLSGYLAQLVKVIIWVDGSELKDLQRESVASGWDAQLIEKSWDAQLI